MAFFRISFTYAYHYESELFFFLNNVIILLIKNNMTIPLDKVNCIA